MLQGSMCAQYTMDHEPAISFGTLRQGGAPVFPDPEAERLNERGTISRNYTREQQAKNAAIVKRKMAPIAKSMAQRIKRARR